MLRTSDYIVLGSGLVMLLLWLAFYLIGLKKAWVFDNEMLNEREFPLHKIYFVGLAMLDAVHYKFKSKHDRLLRKQLAILYDDTYTEFFLRVIYAQRLTYVSLILLLGPILAGLSGNIEVLPAMVIFAGMIYYIIGTRPRAKIEERSEEIMSDFTDVVSKLALMTNAGMILHDAWKEVSETGQSAIYKQMQEVTKDTQNGIAESDALFMFGSKCMVPEIKKFTSTIIQGLSKGNAELVMMLQEQSKEVWNAKKQYVRRQGEKASSKLMLPMMIVFFGILIMVVVPIFTNLGI